MKVFLWPAVCLALLLTACSSIPKANYRDTTGLETPPGYQANKKATKAKAEASDPDVEKGLGDVVKLTGDKDRQQLVIKKGFSRAWRIVAKSLDLADIEIADRNRDKALFYVVFEPDTGLIDSFNLFDIGLFGSSFGESKYRLNLNKIEDSSKPKFAVTATMMEPDIDPDLYEDEEDREEREDASALLLKKLYEVIRDDLPVDY